MAPIKRNTGPTVCPRNRINTTPCPVISLINIDRLINVESTRGTRRRCVSIGSPFDRPHEFI